MPDLEGIEAEVERLIKLGPPKRKVIERVTNTCEMCGGSKGGPVDLGGWFCRCEVVRRKAITALNQIDPAIALTLNTFELKTQTQQDALELARGVNEDSERGIAMFGKPGVGKTHLSVGICRDAFEKGRTFGYYNLVSLVSRIQSSYSGEGFDSRTSIIEEVARRQLVVLDDLGKEHKSPNVESIVYELVDTLYARKRILVVCSNLPSKDYAERYDEAVRSRLAGMCEILVVEGEDARRAS